MSYYSSYMDTPEYKRQCNKYGITAADLPAPPPSLVAPPGYYDEKQDDLPGYIPRKIIDMEDGELERIIPFQEVYGREPTFGQWHNAAVDYIRTGSEESFDKMLRLVSLKHATPNLTGEGQFLEAQNKPITVEPHTSLSGCYELMKPFLWVVAAIFIFAVALMWAMS